MFVSPAIHGSYEFGRIAYHQYVNIYAVHQLYDSWTIVSRPVRPVRVVLSGLKCSVTNDMHVTIDPRAVQPVNHCFTTCTGRTSRTSRVKPFTGRICSTVLDKDSPPFLSIVSHPPTPESVRTDGRTDVRSINHVTTKRNSIGIGLAAWSPPGELTVSVMYWVWCTISFPSLDGNEALNCLPTRFAILQFLKWKRTKWLIVKRSGSSKLLLDSIV